MNSLPLSWSFRYDASEDCGIIRNRNFEWISTPKVSFPFIYEELKTKSESRTNLIIRGCNEEFRKRFVEKGFQFTPFGLEAKLDTSKDHFSKSSLKKLVERGKRHGKILCLEFSDRNKRKLKEFQKMTVHAKDPQLKNLFQSEFTSDNLLLVFSGRNDQWFGALLLSQNSPQKLHIELMLRKEDAPVGVMEALVEKSFKLTKKLGYRELSLGEVPFAIKFGASHGIYTSLSILAGCFFKFAYNYKGLYNFKNKFQPEWEKVYLCSNKKIGFRHYYFLFIHSQFHKLAVRRFRDLITRNSFAEQH